jgi:hypothetical protein
MKIKKGNVNYDCKAKYTYSWSMATAEANANTVTIGGGRTIGGWGMHKTGVTIIRNGLRRGCNVSVDALCPGL